MHDMLLSLTNVAVMASPVWCTPPAQDYMHCFGNDLLTMHLLAKFNLPFF